MRIFFRLKHWQLFIIWILGAILYGITNDASIWILTFEVFVFLLIGWIYSIAKVISVLTTKTNKLVGVDFLFALLLFSSILYVYNFRNLDRNLPVNEFVLISSFSISFLCFFLLVVISAKRLKHFEKKQSLIIFNYIDYFLLLFFIPIGIWVIQPKLNNIIAKV